MANVVPMAGEGTRFSKEGYLLPKVLIPVSGKPMILRAIETMPASDKWIFIVRQEHINRYAIDDLLKGSVPNAIIVPVTETTSGQASTCMLAYEHLDEHEEVFIAACDNAFSYDADRFDELTSRSDVDAVVWTFTERSTLERNPNAWGWCRIGDDGETIEDMSVKVPVSDDPFHDHAVVATFWFKRASEFKQAYDAMVAEDHRIKGEFYVDAMPVFYKKSGLRSVFFDVDLYVGWGTPSDLYEYELIEYFATMGIQPTGVSDDAVRDWERWTRYFAER